METEKTSFFFLSLKQYIRGPRKNCNVTISPLRSFISERPRKEERKGRSDTGRTFWKAAFQKMEWEGTSNWNQEVLSGSASN